MRPAACIHCSYYSIAATDDQGRPTIGECRRSPPQTFMFARQAANLAGKVGLQIDFPAAWPQTPPAAWCGEYHERLEAANG